MPARRRARYRAGYQPGRLLDWRRTIYVLLCDPQCSFVQKVDKAQSATLNAASITDGELIRRVGRKEAGDEAEAVREGLRGEKRVLAFAELRVVKVYRERELVDGDGVGEGRFEKAVSGFLVDDRFAVDLVCLSAGCEREAAALPSVLAGFAADVGERLSPDKLIEGLGDTDDVDESVAAVDEELKGQGEAVAEQTGGDEDAFSAVVRDVSMTDGLVAKLGRVGRGDQGRFAAAAVAESERNKVVRLAGKRAGDGDGHCLDHALEVIAAEVVVAECGVADAVRCMTHRRFVDDLRCLD